MKCWILKAKLINATLVVILFVLIWNEMFFKRKFISNLSIKYAFLVKCREFNHPLILDCIA